MGEFGLSEVDRVVVVEAVNSTVLVLFAATIFGTGFGTGVDRGCSAPKVPSIFVIVSFANRSLNPTRNATAKMKNISLLLVSPTSAG